MVTPEDRGWFGFFRRWRVPTIALVFVVCELLYLWWGTPADRSLAIFVLPPLIIGAFGRWETTA